MIKTYTGRYIDSDLIIDGDLTKPEWQRADWVQLVDNFSGGSSRQSTQAGLLWNQNFLYAAFLCQDDYINATLRNFNEKLYEEEVVEIFLDPDRDLKTYLEIEVNPHNAVLHYEIHNNLAGHILQFARIENRICSMVRCELALQQWSAEIAIPVDEFITAPVAGERWLFNLYRIDRPRDGRDEYSAWSQTGILNFHVPASFGELVFAK